MDPIVKRLMENHAVDTEEEIVNTPADEEVVESDEVDTKEDEIQEADEVDTEVEELDEAIPSEFRGSLKEMSTDLHNIIVACDGFEEGFATKELKRIRQLCSEAMKVLKMIK